jgi:mannose-6-phosphate isomerase
MKLGRRLRFELNEIVSFFVEPTWGYPIALFRIFYGLLAVWTSLFLFPNYERYYTDLGRMPWAKVKHFPEHIYSVIAFDPTNADYLRMLVWIQLLSSILLTLGILSRPATLIIFALQVAFQHRDPYILNSGDHLFLICSFLLFFTPLEQRLSLRNVVEKRLFPERYAKRIGRVSRVWSMRLIGLQICYVYLFAFAAKMNSQPWIRGTAMYDVLASPSLARFPAELDHPVLLAIVTWGTLAFELGFPLLVWQKPFRPYVIAAGLLFHLGIEFSMILPMFSCMMMISYCVFLDDDEAQALLRIPLKLFGFKGPNEPAPRDDLEAEAPEELEEQDPAQLPVPLPIRGAILPYAWGSRTSIAEVLGALPGGGPEAEYWLGAHAGGPAELLSGGGDLASFIRANPESALGPQLSARYGAELPFLMKVLAAASPLSLQAHPSREQAQAGYAKERALGIDPKSKTANYKDGNAKPELLFALTPFRALYGFCSLERAQMRLETLGLGREESPFAGLVNPQKPLAAALFRQAFVERALALKRTDAEPLLAAILERVAAPVADAPDPLFAALPGLIRAYPDDGGVFVALLMNYVEIEPGQAIFLPARNLHAYLEGTGLEVMASSDNVLRGGLTPKHVDIAELCRVLNFEEEAGLPLAPQVGRARGSKASETTTFHTTASEFELSILELVERDRVDVSGPAILFVLGGSIELAWENGVLDLARGAACFVPFACRGVGLSSREPSSREPSSRVAWVSVPQGLPS